MLEMGLTSVAEVYDFIKQFHFRPGQGVDLFNSVEYSDTDLVRLSPSIGEVTLKREAVSQFYSTDDDIWFRTWVTNPLAMRQIKMLQLFPNLQLTDTSRQVRIYDGTDDYYWDGAAWSVAGAGNWNTEADFNANIEAYDVLPGRQFAITVNLKTTDREITPTVDEIRVLMSVHIDYIEDIVLRSLMPSLEGAIDPTARLTNVPAFEVDSDTIDLSEYRMNIPYTISDIAGVYDLTDDLELLYNLLDTYTPSTGIITLTSDIPAGNRPLVVIRYIPEVIFIQHQDWYEVTKVPCLLLQQLEVPQTTAYNLAAREGIVDKGTGNAVVLQEPWRATFEFRMHGLTASVVDEMRLMSRVIQYFEENPVLRSTGLDEYYRMRIEREFRDLSSPNRADQRAFWTRFSVNDVRMPMVSTTAKAVQRVSLTFKGPKPAHEDPLKGGARVIANTHVDGGPVEFEETVEIT
jgi:hypothetical protein